MYGQFASVYDLLMDDVNYPAWADYYLEIVRRALGRQARSLCECACGTGSISIELARRNLTVTGVDISPQMLERAARKARAAGVKLPFVCQDMRALCLPRPVDAVICPCDGLNYLAPGAQAERFFRAAHKALQPGGVLAFDFSTRFKLERMARDGLYYEDREEISYFWRNALRGERLEMELTFFVREAGGLYRRFDENQAQYLHDAKAVEQSLARCGFSPTALYGDKTFAPPRPDEARIHMTAARL